MNSYPKHYPFPVYPQPMMMPTPFPYFYPWRVCPGAMMPYLPPMMPMNPLRPIEPHPGIPGIPRPVPPYEPYRPPFEPGQSPWIQAYQEREEDRDD